jgi:hypothetical protein
MWGDDQWEQRRLPWGGNSFPGSAEKRKEWLRQSQVLMVVKAGEVSEIEEPDGNLFPLFQGSCLKKN